MKKFILFNLVLVISLLLCSCGLLKDQDLKDNSLEEVKSKGELVLGLDISFPPMGYKDPNTGGIIGFDIDIAKEVAKRMGLELKLQPIDWDNKQVELMNSNVDCLWNGFSKTEEREKNFLLSIPYMDNRQVILTGKNKSYNSLDDLKDKALGVQNDSSAYYALSEDKNKEFKDSLKQIVKLDSYSKLLTEIDNNTIDAVLIDEIVARFYMRNKSERYKLLTDKNNEVLSIAFEEYVIGFRQNDHALKNAIDNALIELSHDGMLAAVSYKWFGEDITCVTKS